MVGTAGVGKTTLVVRAAHRLGQRFPEGQLYVNLRGVEPQRLEPADVLSNFLRALGVDGGHVPRGVEERAAMFPRATT